MHRSYHQEKTFRNSHSKSRDFLANTPHTKSAALRHPKCHERDLGEKALEAHEN